jgi:hypothetical protein
MKIAWKVALGLSALLLFTGCAKQATPTPTPTVTAAIKTCLSPQLSVNIGTQGGAMGTVGFSDMGFTNVSSLTCTLTGYPKMQMLDASGKSIPTFISNDVLTTMQGNSLEVVTLAPGKVARFDFRFSSATGYGTSYCPTSTDVAFTPPGETLPIVVHLAIAPYGGGTIQKLHCGEIIVSPVRARISAP